MNGCEKWVNIAHPVDWRYGSKELRSILSPCNIVKYYALVEATVADVEAELGVIPRKAADEIIKASKKVTYEDTLKWEKVTKHDITALIHAISDNCHSEECRRYIHYGLTSQDIKDTAFALLIKDALTIIKDKLCKLIDILLDYSMRFLNTVCVGRTHGVHANVYLLGHKFAVFADEFLRHLERLEEGKKRYLVGKISGAVGIHAVLGEKGPEVEERVLRKLGLYRSYFSTQVVPRDRYAEFFLILSLISSSLDRLATEIRNLHRTEIGELMEGFVKGQTGSSAMPHKRNPIDSENISSLSRIVRGLVVPTLENIVLWHERDLTNSASERVLLADFLLIIDEQLKRAIRVLENLSINEDKLKENLWLTKGLIFSEYVMYKLIEKGLDRVSAHSLIIDISSKVINKNLSFQEALLENEVVSNLLTEEEIEEIFDPDRYLKVAQTIIRALVQDYENKVKKEICKDNSLKSLEY